MNDIANHLSLHTGQVFIFFLSVVAFLSLEKWSWKILSQKILTFLDILKKPRGLQYWPKSIMITEKYFYLKLIFFLESLEKNSDSKFPKVKYHFLN